MSKIEHPCLSVVCPMCMAIRGVPCRPRKNPGGYYQKPHKARVDLYNNRILIKHDLGAVPDERIIMKELKEVIKNIINEKQGIKAVDLAIAIPIEVLKKYKVEDLFTVIDELEKEEEIVVVRYCLAAMPYREKSFLLPKNTITMYGDRLVL